MSHQRFTVVLSFLRHLLGRSHARLLIDQSNEECGKDELKPH
jgi:hypothetical protein